MLFLVVAVAIAIAVAVVVVVVGRCCYAVHFAFVGVVGACSVRNTI